LETYQSDVHQADPDPDVPRCFLDLKRTKEMVRGWAGANLALHRKNRLA
jgi:hypothetical protein